MLDIKLSYKAKVLLKKLNSLEYMHVERKNVAAANELLSHKLVIGCDLMKNGFYGSIRLTKEGRVFYLSNPSLNSPIDWKWITSIIISILGIIIGLTI